MRPDQNLKLGIGSAQESASTPVCQDHSAFNLSLCNSSIVCTRYVAPAKQFPNQRVWYSAGCFASRTLAVPLFLFFLCPTPTPPALSNESMSGYTRNSSPTSDQASKRFEVQNRSTNSNPLPSILQQPTSRDRDGPAWASSLKKGIFCIDLKKTTLGFLASLYIPACLS